MLLYIYIMCICIFYICVHYLCTHFCMDTYFHFFWVLRSRMAGSYGICIFNFLSNLYTICHGGYTNLHSYQNAQAFPFLDIFANMLYLVFFADSHSNRYKVCRFCSSHIKNVKEQVQLI